MKLFAQAEGVGGCSCLHAVVIIIFAVDQVFSASDLLPLMLVERCWSSGGYSFRILWLKLVVKAWDR